MSIEGQLALLVVSRGGEPTVKWLRHSVFGEPWQRSALTLDYGFGDGELRL